MPLGTFWGYNDNIHKSVTAESLDFTSILVINLQLRFLFCYKIRKPCKLYVASLILHICYISLSLEQSFSNLLYDYLFYL